MDNTERLPCMIEACPGRPRRPPQTDGLAVQQSIQPSNRPTVDSSTDRAAPKADMDVSICHHGHGVWPAVDSGTAISPSWPMIDSAVATVHQCLVGCCCLGLH